MMGPQARSTWHPQGWRGRKDPPLELSEGAPPPTPGSSLGENRFPKRPRLWEFTRQPSASLLPDVLTAWP